MNDSLEQLKLLSRQIIHQTWQAGQAGVELDPKSARMYKIMRQHPRYFLIWDHLDPLTGEQIERDGVNPVLHIQFHLIVENQIAEENPKEVRQIIKALVRQGSSRHKAIHAVGNVLAGEIYYMMRDQRVFDEAEYLRKLDRLVKARH